MWEEEFEQGGDETAQSAEQRAKIHVPRITGPTTSRTP